MSNTEMNFRLSISVPHPFRDINNLIRDLKRYAEEIPKHIFSHIMIEHQEYLLKLYLGESRIGIQKIETPWKCPRCESQHGFSRRGWRSKPRTLKTSVGTLEFPLKNISCKKCDKTFSPFPEFWGLEPWQRISKELAENAIYLATQFSYKRSSDALKRLTNQSLSALSIQRLVQKHSPNITCKNNDTNAETLMFDDTRVPAGSTGNEPLLLGVSIDGTYEEYGRTRLKKSITLLEISKSWRDLGRRVEQYNPKSVVTDGDLAIKKMVADCFPESDIQQCIWHLFYTSNHYLWKDGLPVADRQPLLRELSKLIKQEDKEQIEVFIKKLKELKLKNTANFIERGLDDLLTYTTVDIPYKATSPIEREMREINRRSDVGARWSVSGLYNLLNLKLAHEKNNSVWNDYWNDKNYLSRDNQFKMIKI